MFPKTSVYLKHRNKMCLANKYVKVLPCNETSASKKDSTQENKSSPMPPSHDDNDDGCSIENDELIEFEKG